MALFTNAILAGEPIKVFNNGRMRRDFTYIDDIVEGVVRVIDLIPPAAPAGTGDAYARPPRAPRRSVIYNIGNSQPVELLEYIALLEEATGKRATLDLQPMQPGDVLSTSADTRALEAAVGFRPRTPLAEGLRRYVAWHRAYYGAAGRAERRDPERVGRGAAITCRSSVTDRPAAREPVPGGS